MQTTDRIEFVKVLNGMASMRKQQLLPEVLDLWWHCMAQWAIDDFKIAAVQLMKTSQFMPSPKDFEDLKKAGRKTAGEAWIDARKYIRWGLHAYTLDEGCPELLARAIFACGGPNAIGMCNEADLRFIERRFAEHYETMQDSDAVRAAVPGIAYLENRRDHRRIESAIKKVTSALKGESDG